MQDKNNQFPQESISDNRAVQRPPHRPLAVNAKEAAELCGISRTLWYDLKNAGRIPEPIRLGRRTLWRVDEIQKWMTAGCPGLDRWRQMKKQTDRNG